MRSVIVLLVIASWAKGQDVTTNRPTTATFTGEQKAFFLKVGSKPILGTLRELGDTEVYYRPGRGKHITVSSQKFQAVVTATDAFIYREPDRGFRRLGPIIVHNTTDEPLVVTLLSARNYAGAIDIIVNNYGEPKAEGLIGFKAQFESGTTRRHIKLKDVQMTLKPDERQPVKVFGEPIKSTYATLGLKNIHGRSEMKVEHDFKTDDMVVSVGTKDVHPPLLVKLGEWKVFQDRDRISKRISVDLKRSSSKGGISTYTQTQGAVETVEYRYAGKAIAEASIENITDRRVRVHIEMAFHFENTLQPLSKTTHDMVLEPGEKTIAVAWINAMGLYKNRPANAAETLDIDTTLAK